MKYKLKINLTNFQFFFLSIFLFLIINFIGFSEKLLSFQVSFWVICLFLFLNSLFISSAKGLKIFFGIFWVITSIIVFFKFTLNITYGIEVALSFIQTFNEPEIATELLDLKFILWLIFVTFLPVFFIFYNIKIIKKYNFKYHVIIMLIFVILSYLHIMKIRKYQKKEPDNLSSGISSTVLFSPIDFFFATNKAYGVIKLNKSLKDSNFIELSKKFEYEKKTQTNNLKVILIIGETARWDRFSVNGYKKQTNPYLERQGKNFFNFGKMNACNTFTVGSINCITSRMTFENYTEILKESAITDVYKSLGFKIKIISMQAMYSFYDYLGYDFLISKYEIMNKNKKIKKSVDEHLLPFFEETLKERGNDFILLHMMGSHISYHHRYLESFEKWKPVCNNTISNCTKEELNNAYDNSILYTDFVLHKIYEIANKRNAIVFFTSDHGESLGENGFFAHASPQKIAPKEQLEVPFFVFLTNKFLETEQGKFVFDKLRKIKKHSLSHDNIFHSLLSCSGVVNKNLENPLIEKNLDICN